MQTLQSRQSACYHFLVRPAVRLQGKGVSMLSAQACWSLPHPKWTCEETQTQLTRWFTPGPASNSKNTNSHEFVSSISQLAWHRQSPFVTSQSTQWAPTALPSAGTFPGGRNTPFVYLRNKVYSKNNKNPSEPEGPSKTTQEVFTPYRRSVGTRKVPYKLLRQGYVVSLLRAALTRVDSDPGVLRTRVCSLLWSTKIS